MSRSPLRLAVLATTAVVTTLAAATASASPPRSFYGVSAQAELEPADYARMGSGLVGTLRVALAWSRVDPTILPLDHSWAEFDEVVASAAEQGVRVLPVVVSTPGWVSGMEDCASNCDKQPPHSDAGLAAWRSFLGAAVSRYGSEGSFWLANPTLPRMPVTAWQIWNEQNGPIGSDPDGVPRARPGVYGRLVAAASEAIDDVDPSAEVILGGMFGTPFGKRNPATNSWSYLRALYRQPGFASHFDGVAAHPYSTAMKGVRAQVRLLRAEMTNAGDASAGLWITEIGWSSAARERGEPLKRGPGGQAKRLRQAFRYFTENRGRLNVRNVDWFSWRDAPASKLELCTRWCPDSGLFTLNDFRAKPAWAEYVKFTGGV